jgi:hypothetical protein
VSNVVQRKSLGFSVVLACSVLVAAGMAALAGDKKEDKGKPALAGVWALQGGELTLTFADKGSLKISPHGKDDLILIRCKYTRAKDGRLQAKITGLEGKAREKVEGVVPVGLEFNFRWVVKDDKATLEDVKGDKVEMLKSHLEGSYQKK